MGDTLDRTVVVATGALIWSACTVGVSMSSNLVQACVFTTFNGLGLALVIPCAQSLMADYYPAEQRGRAFGAMQLTMSFGSMLGSLFATNIAKYKVPSLPFHRKRHSIGSLLKYSHCVTALRCSITYQSDRQCHNLSRYLGDPWRSLLNSQSCNGSVELASRV